MTEVKSDQSIDEHNVVIRRAGGSDLKVLYSVSRQAYTESFADHWNEGGLEWYLNKVYGWDVLTNDLNNSGVIYFIAFVKGDPAGFMKIKLDSPLVAAEKGNIEIEKLYFLRRYQRMGLGKKLMSSAIQLGQSVAANMIWLGVIDTNNNAIQFYTDAGFTKFDKVKLEIPYFKDELRGMWRMTMQLS